MYSFQGGKGTLNFMFYLFWGPCVTVHLQRSEDNLQNQFFPSAVLNTGIKLRSSVLATSAILLVWRKEFTLVPLRA